jgi:hypothetical protein
MSIILKPLEIVVVTTKVVDRNSGSLFGLWTQTDDLGRQKKPGGLCLHRPRSHAAVIPHKNRGITEIVNQCTFFPATKPSANINGSERDNVETFPATRANRGWRPGAHPANG